MPNSEVPLQALPGGIELNRQAGEVRAQGLKINLPEQLFRLLALLVEHSGEVVTREEIRKSLWSDSFVNFDDSINSAVRRLRQSLESASLQAPLIETLPGYGYRFVGLAKSGEAITPFPEKKNESAKPRLAVLPFENLSGDAGEEYLADSLTDAVITVLAKIPTLQVKPTCLMMGYKQSRHKLFTVGRNLKVDAVLQGSVVQIDGRLRITAQLLKVKTEEHMWAESYTCQSRDLFASQMEVAEKIATQVTDKLAPSWRPRSPYTLQPVAQNSHLKAHLTFRMFTNDGFWKSRRYWKEAVRRDPGFAQAFAGLAESYNMLGMTGLLDSKDALGEAQLAAKRALAIDTSLAEAHVALGHTYTVERKWEAAAQEFRMAQQFDPNFVAGNPCHYVEFLMATGEREAAVKEIERIWAAHPLRSFLGVMLGWALYGNRDYDRALRQHQEVLRNDPEFGVTHVMLALDYAQRKRYRSAIEHCRKMISDGGTRIALNALGFIYATAGDKHGAKEVLTELKGLLRNGYASPYASGAIYAGMGEANAAFDFLNLAYEVHDPELIWLGWDPQFDNVRADARFQNLLNRMGLRTEQPSPNAPTTR